MSILVDIAPLVPDAIVVRTLFGLGVPGSAIPQDSYLRPFVSLPADADVEFRGLVLSHTLPDGTFAYYDDGTTSVSAPNGTYSYTFRLYRDGVPQSPLVTNFVTIGPSGALSIQAALDPFASALSLAPQLSELAIGASLGAFSSSVSLSTQPSLSVAAALLDFSSLLTLFGDIAGTVPANLSAARRFKVLPDASLDPYSLDQKFALTWEKDPQASLDYSLDWEDWLLDVQGDSIANMYATKSDGLSVTAQAIRGPLTAIVASGGAVGAQEWATIRIVTAQGRIEERTINLAIRER